MHGAFCTCVDFHSQAWRGLAVVDWAVFLRKALQFMGLYRYAWGNGGHGSSSRVYFMSRVYLG